MQKINTRPRGFFTFAQNNDKVDYVRLAYGLALSLKKSQIDVPYLTIGITPGTQVNKKYLWAFDNVIEIPWKDYAANSSWKLENEWKSIWMSPYDETIKLDSDMLFFSDIGSWWENLSKQANDIVWTNTVLDWRGFPVDNDHYRKVFTANNLPNIYSGCGYFRKTDMTYEFFNLSRMIFWNWEKFYEEFLGYEHRPDYPSTDVIFAIASKILDFEGTSYVPAIIPTFTHMKSHLQGWKVENISEDWRMHVDMLFTPAGECKIGNHLQVYPLHYHIKDALSDKILDTYERLLKR
jgi:hypothetical protein